MDATSESGLAWQSHVTRGEAADKGKRRSMRMMAQVARVAAPEAPVPVEPGKATVVVTVSGSVQLH